MVIEIRGREYSVEKIEGNPNANLATLREVSYRLTSVRGAVYTTIRNVKDPHMMFICSMSKTLDRVWLSDKDGQLVVVRS